MAGTTLRVAANISSAQAGGRARTV